MIIEGNQLRVALCAYHVWHRITHAYSQIDLIFVPAFRDKAVLIQDCTFQEWVKATIEWRFEDEEAYKPLDIQTH